MGKVYTISELQKILTPIFQQNGVKRTIPCLVPTPRVSQRQEAIDLLVDNGLRRLAFFSLMEDIATAIEAPMICWMWRKLKIAYPKMGGRSLWAVLERIGETGHAL